VWVAAVLSRNSSAPPQRTPFHQHHGHRSDAEASSAFSESESDNATEGVIWKARDLWSAPVEWSNPTECKNGSLTSLCSHQERQLVGILRAAAAALSPSGSMSSSKAAPPHSRRVGCHKRGSASVLHAGAGLLRTRTPAAPSKCTTPP